MPKKSVDDREMFEMSVADVSALGSVIPSLGESGAVYEDGKLFVPRGDVLDQITARLADMPKARQEAGLANLRAKRNRMLAESDWTQLPDVPQAVKDAWRGYRQALRDLPENVTDPLNFEWPEKPLA